MFNILTTRKLVSSLGTAAKFLRLSNSRSISDSSAYDGDGKTTVRVLNDEDSSINLVNTYSAYGFRLSNNLHITGSIILFPTQVFSWAVRRGEDITLESLRVFDLIVPKLKILVVGYGRTGEPFDSSIPLKLRSKGYSCEILPTPQALTTYNYLVSDGVHVAGAFVTVRGDVVMEHRDIAALNEEVGKPQDPFYLSDACRTDAAYYRSFDKHLKKDERKKSFD